MQIKIEIDPISSSMDRVTVSIPCEKYSKRIDSNFIDLDTRLLFQKLSCYWGNYDEKSNCRTHSICTHPLYSKDYVFKVKRTLERIKKHNEHKRVKEVHYIDIC